MERVRILWWEQHLEEDVMELDTEKMIARTEGGVGWMIFNNPERLNAQSFEMKLAIPQILAAFDADDDVRVVVMTGAGDRAFVSGADISEFAERRSDPESIKEYDAVSARMEGSLEELKKPLIAMIRGYALGGGLEIALKADVRIASDNAQFGIPAVKLGLGFSYEHTEALVQAIGPAATAEMLLTGRRIPAAEAAEIGLVNRVVPDAELESTVRGLAETIAANAPLAVKLVKASVRESLKAEAQRDLGAIERLVAECFASRDYAEGRTAFMEKRTPDFAGR
jgi:enoyl-CoA hydratase/carnithine racemase